MYRHNQMSKGIRAWLIRLDVAAGPLLFASSFYFLCLVVYSLKLLMVVLLDGRSPLMN